MDQQKFNRETNRNVDRLSKMIVADPSGLRVRPSGSDACFRPSPDFTRPVFTSVLICVNLRTIPMRSWFSLSYCRLLVGFARADWPQWGGSGRNNVSPAKNLPAEWSVGEFDRTSGAWKSDGAKNVLWAARLGSQSYGTPVVAGGKVFCSTNNGAGYLARYPQKSTWAACWPFAKPTASSSGSFRVEKHPAGSDVDWPKNRASARCRWSKATGCGS